jgi:hypothetical protein
MVAGGRIECLDCPGTFASIRDLPPMVNPAAHKATVTGRAEITPKGRALLRGET